MVSQKLIKNNKSHRSEVLFSLFDWIVTGDAKWISTIRHSVMLSTVVKLQLSSEILSKNKIALKIGCGYSLVNFCQYDTLQLL